MTYFDNSATENWLKIKWQKFSSSTLHPLTINGKGEMFGEGAKTAIMKVARQSYTMFNMEDKVETYDMRVGIAKEPECFAFYKRLIGLEALTHHGGANPIFKHFTNDSGCSPDCTAPIPDTDKISFGAEFKNPSGETHFKYLFDIEKQEDLKKVKPEYYTQVQFSMMCYDVDIWHWASYNEFFPLKERMLILEVKKDFQFCNNLEIRLMQASKLKNKIVEMRMNGYKGTIDFNKL